ncbi:MAG TPA: ATP-binding protein [Burkholderiales bacterium]|nr:ATP-binding protein [Burkholderiales bacterium]
MNVPSPASETRLTRLFWLRNVSIAGQATAVVVAHIAFGIELPLLPLAATIGMLALMNLTTWWRLRRMRAVSDPEIFGQLCADVLLLTLALYLTGGATNPFVSLYLLPLTIAAIALPARHAWAMASLTAAAYSLLLFWYQPLGHGYVHHHSDAFELHVLGMWFNFLLSAVLIVYFIGRMAASVRARERELTEARERVLRDEQLVMLGTFAAGAAHELGTPLSTMAVVVRELEREHASDGALTAGLATLRSQVEHCKHILTRLVERTGQARSEGVRLRALDAVIDEAVERWKLLRPEARLRVRMEGQGPVPQIAAEETLTQALVNVLNNAADASPEDVELVFGWAQSEARLEIWDRGCGLSDEALGRAGREPYTEKAPRGLGLGLLLANATFQRIGGTLSLDNHGQGGCARVTLPIVQPA